MREHLAAGCARTLGDVVEHRYASRDADPTGIAPQLELNRFVRRWHHDDPDGSRVDARET